jgi:hypothetical protein
LLSFGATQTIYINNNSSTIPTTVYMGTTQYKINPTYPSGNPLAGIYVVTLYVNGVYTANRLIVIN